MTQLNGHSDQPSITGLQAHLGEGAHDSKGFWGDAWSHILTRRAAIIALVWVGVVAFFAVTAPLLASGHPLVIWPVADANAEAFFIVSGTGREERASQFTSEQLAQRSWTIEPTDGDPIRYRKVHRLFPLFRHLSSADWALLVGGLVAPIVLFWPSKMPRGPRLGFLVAAAIQAGIIVVIAQLARGLFDARDPPEWARHWRDGAGFVPIASAVIAVAISALAMLIPSVKRPALRAIPVVLVGVVTGLIVWQSWNIAPTGFNYAERVRQGEIRALWTLVPWSPAERPNDRDAKLLPPGSTVDQALARRVVTTLAPSGVLMPDELQRALHEIDRLPLVAHQRDAIHAGVTAWINTTPEPTRAGLQTLIEDQLAHSGRMFVLGSDDDMQDVLSQLLHACRLAISIGLISTSIAVIIGVTLGALMGYFGGVVDLVLYRIVEIFMSIPLLFILIVAAGVLPRNTYVTMAIIGCFTWTTAARFTRAEFLKLRHQDFVQAARGVGLPLRSVLFRHMLPNAVTPVLVDASFAIAFAIILEATLSYLGLGPADQASWGGLLADATNEVGQFLWWLAIFPGLAIFLAALSYNLIGEALRDAIDPKLKKARV